jgi:clan AA aspartic protease
LTGYVDDHNRALIDVEVRREPGTHAVAVTTWIDTAFDGHLVFPLSLIHQLNLESLADTDAILADGKLVTMETYLCYLDWFGELIPLQVIANEGKLPLLGTGLLEQHVRHVDYVAQELELD